MPLITRIGSANANSFVTLDQAEYILGTLPDDLESWNELTLLEKEYRLTMAAKIIGVLPLKGRRVYRWQALAFPRTLRVSKRTWPYHYQQVQYASVREDLWQAEPDCRRVPDEVKEAQCMVAYSVVHRALANRSVVTEQQGSTVTGISLGGALSVSFSPGQEATGSLLDMIMRSLQAPVYLMMQKWISQMRGGVITAVEDADYWEPSEVLPTTTTTTTSTTVTSTSSSTTTTTAP